MLLIILLRIILLPLVHTPALLLNPPGIHQLVQKLQLVGVQDLHLQLLSLDEQLLEDLSLLLLSKLQEALLELLFINDCLGLVFLALFFGLEERQAVLLHVLGHLVENRFRGIVEQGVVPNLVQVLLDLLLAFVEVILEFVLNSLQIHRLLDDFEVVGNAQLVGVYRVQEGLAHFVFLQLLQHFHDFEFVEASLLRELFLHLLFVQFLFALEFLGVFLDQLEGVALGQDFLDLLAHVLAQDHFEVVFIVVLQVHYLQLLN